MNKFLIFGGKKIRKVLHNGEWYFSVVDIVGILTGSLDSRKYWNKLSQRLKGEGGQLVTICHQLKLEASDGKKYLTDCANKQGIFRIIQSIPSKRVEPFKLWLAKVGSDRIDEIENPELAQNRAREYYRNKKYPEDWIDKRMRGIAIRQDLTDEWKTRGVDEKAEYAILTNEISKATFGKSVGEHRKIKKLEVGGANLRDYMTDWELILTIIGEKATTDISVANDSEGFSECLDSAIDGGEIAGNTRREIEKKTGKAIVAKENFIGKKKKRKKEVVINE